MIRAGDLRKSIKIQQLAPNSPDQDAGGAPDEAWTDLYTALASVSPLRGRELLQAQQISSEVTGQIKVRYRPEYSITSKMRVLFGTRKYDILAVVDTMEQHREVILYVREGVNSG